MSVCSICGAETRHGVEASRNNLCAECLKIEKASARRTIWMVGVVILVAVFGAGGLITTMMLGMREEPHIEQPTIAPSKTETRDREPQIEVYAEQVRPEIQRMRLEMETVWTGIKTFLQEVNTTTEKSAIRTKIDAFREEMRQHAARFREIEERLQKIALPTVAESEHKRLIGGLAHYRAAVEGYAEGLAAYRFERIKQSQESLEQADKEIRDASAALVTVLDRSKAK